MNRTKHTVQALLRLGVYGILLALLCSVATTANAVAVTKCEYWIDRDFDSRTAVTPASDAWSAQLDVSDLDYGVHSIAVRMGTDDGLWSAPTVKYFIVPQATSVQENTVAGYEYWIDRDFDNRTAGTFGSGGLVETDIDLGSLGTGVHSFAFRAIDDNGHVSPVMVKYFIVPEQAVTTANALVNWRYWIDRDVTAAVETSIGADGVVMTDLDLADLSPGVHSISYQVKDEQGRYSPALTSYFVVPEDASELTEGDKIVAYEYWFNDNPRKRVEVEPSATLELDGVLLAVEGVEPETVPADYAFDVATKQVIYTQDVDFGLQVFNNLGTGSSAVTQTIEGHQIFMDTQMVTLANEQASTLAAPTGNKVQGYQFDCQAGDKLYWFMDVDESLKVDFYDADGVRIDAEAIGTETIDGQQALTVTATTAAVYALTYGAADAEAQSVVKVALPVSITVNDSGREYGEDNPEFTFSSEQEDIIIGTPAYVTAADASSPVGGYAVSIDRESIGNSVVTITDGTLTVTKATLTVTADNQEREYGEENPELTFTISGWKGSDDESVLTTQPVASTDAAADSDAGDYTITVSGGEAENYEFTYVNGTLTVTKATLTVTADNQEREYGEENPELTFTISGWKGSDDESVLTTQPVASTDAAADSDVGDYTITVSGGEAENYDFTYVNGTLTVTKATLTVTADNQEREYGEENPELTFTISGWKGSDDESVLTTQPVASTDAAADSDVGDYTITVSGGEAENYEFVYVDGTLTVHEQTGVVRINGDRLSKPADAYNVQGAKVATGVTSLKQLPAGTYIIGGKKVVVR